jgi:DnaJ-class molecular chaperone
MAERCNVSIDLDDRGFWHINCYLIHDDPGDDGDVPDAACTTKRGASLDDAMAIARQRYHPETITVWEACSECCGSGTHPDDPDDQCDECEDGQQFRVIVMETSNV